ncbi:MAG TPA: amino acid adenylation domain-containing protein, partial [Thermoanaerobaculia bacterium]|nr:amino acid adenylation domain-containing protein [Thermoanaerobaculia bacterium]
MAPRTPVEEVVAAIWSDVLGLERVGAEDNFFALGGHSLVATRVTSRLREALGVEVPLRDLFEAPTVSGLAGRVERALRAGQGVDLPAMELVSRDQSLPLSFAQQRLWFLDQLDPGSAAYNLPAAVRLSGSLSRPVLAAALTEIVRRHESLRTTFGRIGPGEPVQVIAASGPVALPVVDLSGLPEPAHELEALRLAKEEAQRPFDLERGPLLRVTLVATAATEHAVLLTLHHIVGDAWSTGLLVQELGTLYTTFAAGRPSPLPELGVQYADFAAWQRQWLSGAVLERQLAWWRERLAGALTLELPADRPRPAVRTPRGGRQEIRWSRELSEGLASLARHQGATPFMVLLAGLQALLARYAGQPEVSVGTPIAGRNHLHAEGLIGFFVNTLVLRTELGDAPGFAALIGRVRETALGAYAHQDLPFEKLVEELSPQRDLSRTPLFQVMFALQNAPVGALELPGLTLGALPADSGTAKFDLTLILSEDPEGLAGVAVYSQDLFDGVTIQRLLASLETLFAGALSSVSAPLSALPLMGPAERHQALLEWNDTAALPEAEVCVHRLVEAQAESRPDATALASRGLALTYGELNARANQLACHLRSLGMEPEELAAVCLDRSLEEGVAQLAVLKTGGAYLPLDPAHPRERLARTIAGSGARVLLTTAARAGDLAAAGLRTVCMDRDWPEIARHSRTGFESGATAGNLAYVIYTSGSTGVPKGVEVGHRSLSHLLSWHQRAFAVSPEERASRLSGPAFDASVWELWPYLAAGASVYLPDEETRLSPDLLRDWLAAEGIALAFLSTPLAEALLSSGWPETAALRLLLTGGDKLHEAPPSPLPFRLVNNYGPTENTVVATSGTVPAGLRSERSPSIGRPIDGVRTYVLDRHLQPLPPGAPGELYLAGDGLARGYRHSPDLTAEKLVPDFLGGRPGDRLYRTGDLARFLPDGELEFLGRVDHQVKIRGFRIELGEIETVLRQAPSVETAVVLAREDVPGDRRLVAYLVGTPEELRRFLRERLPEYMVPAAFVWLEALPLTPNGKVDLRSLPAPEAARPALEPAPVAPRTPVEEVVAAIWSDVLGLERVGAEDNFFALGGHSLVATRVTSRLREALGVEVPLRDLFEAPTVSGLAGRVERALRAGQGVDLSLIERTPRNQPLPLSFAQERLWFLDQLEPGSAIYNIPLALRLQGPLDPLALGAALGEVVRRHEPLRTTFLRTPEGVPVQVIAPAGPLALPVVDLAALPAAARDVEVRRLATAEAERPFNLAAGPLLRAALLRLGEGDHAALVTMHHIVSDGWSIGIFLAELAASYEGLPLPELPIQYADFSSWQRRWLDGEALASQLAYWRRQLAAAPQSLDLPADRPRPAVQSFRGSSRPVALAAGLSAALAGLSRRAGATPFMTLLAAFQALLGRTAGEADLVVGTPIAGRTRREVEGLIGLFVNTLALRADLSGDPSFRGLLARVRQTSLDAYAHQDLPFERLVEELQPVRDLSRNPVFQVMFTLQNAPRTVTGMAELALSPLGVEGGTAKFDLMLAVQESEEGIQGSLGYNTDLFDEATAMRLLSRFERLLAAVAEDPEQRLSQLPAWTEPERHQMLVEWNDTPAVTGAGRTLHELFAAQAERTPEAVAVVWGEERWTYRQLDRRAGQVARRLAEQGVGPEVRAGVCARRGPELVAALLGVLEAGGAYVPLDPSYPAERLAFMLADAGVRVLLTERELLPDLADEAVPTLCLEEIDSEADASRPAPRSGPAHLAYVIYTSGSTGLPKGVAIEHRSAVALVEWSHTVFTAAELDGVLAATSVSFDLSVFELFVPLCRGGRVILAQNALELPSLAAAGEVRLVNTVPSAMAELLRLGGLPPGVMTVSLAGEALPGALAQRLHGVGVRRVLNLYGPSEDTTYSTGSRVEPGAGEPAIGRPIAGTRAYVLDRALEPVPLGAVGELHLGGAGLARGYLGRPQETADRFVPDALGGRPGERLYRTGDLVRYRPDG